MRSNDKVDHPEIFEIVNICAVSPDLEGTKEICELIKATSTTKSKTKSQKRKAKKDKELDSDLKDTFPASDPVTHY